MEGITKEAILIRKQALQADLNAIAGALQDCDYWLAQLAEPVEEGGE